jgi:PAS domain S-box-containing protein
MREDGVTGQVARTAGLTVVAVLGIELLFDRFLHIPTPIAVLAVVTYAAFVWGLVPGPVGAAIASAYGVYFYRVPGPVLAYATADLLRALMLVVTAFAIATIVGLLRRTTRAAEDARREQLLFTSALNESMGDGLYATDSAGRITFANPAAERILGYAPGELLGQHAHDLIHSRRADGSLVPAAVCPLLGAARSGQPYRDDDVCTRKDGTFLPAAYSSSPFCGVERWPGPWSPSAT